MNTKQIATIGIALLVAGGAFVFMQKQTQKNNAANAQQAAPPAPAIETVKVLVAANDLILGSRISDTSLQWMDWPKTAISPAFITETAQKNAITLYKNAVVKIPIVKGEPIVATKLVIADAKSGVMAALLTPGMRAVTVNVKSDTGVAGFILPDNRVDVFLTRTIAFPLANGSTVNRTVTSTILENVRVLAIDQRIAQEANQQAMTGSAATLELSQGDAETLSRADSMGDISLALRSYADVNGPTVARPDAVALSQPIPVVPKTATQTPPAYNANVGSVNNQQAQNNVKIYRGGQ